jgi:uncharacterized protein
VVDLELRLRDLIRADPWSMEVLAAVRVVDPPNWVVGAGVIRNLVWDRLHGFAERTPATDVDVAFFDSSDLSRDRDRLLEDELAVALPGVPWEVTNQAGVHLWYQQKFGHPIDPITSIDDAVARWPETATAVAVRLEPDDAVTIVAPCGLDDLFGMVLRRNDRQVSAEYFRSRLVSKRIAERWPQVTVVFD